MTRAWWVPVLFAVSCGPVDERPRCLPGEARACLGPGRCEGVSVCLADGASLGPCDCGRMSLDGGGATSDGGTTPGRRDGSDAGTGPGDDGGPGGLDAGLVAANCPAPLPAPWMRGALTRIVDVPAVEIRGARLNPFPNSGMTGLFLTRNDEYLAVEFTTPASASDWAARAAFKLFEWDQSQVGGAASLSRVFITVSRCPGDFRLAPPGQTAPLNDPTFARGCTNFRPRPPFPASPASNLAYVIDTAPADDVTCRLVPGQRYFLNVIRADASDGSIGRPETEASCANPELTSCGVQLRIH